jgi:VanZ family protein
MGIENPFVRFVHSIPFGDKIGHICIFGCLTLLLNHALSYSYFLLLDRRLPKGTFFVFSFALLEECTQLFFVSRTFDFGDILSDLVGIIIATTFAYRPLNTGSKS